MNAAVDSPVAEPDVAELEVLITAEQIRERVAQLGKEISLDYANLELHLVGVLKGGFVFLADLLRQLTVPCRVHFLQASSYQDRKTSSGVVKLTHDLQLKGKHVLVVEDIFDTGLTLERVVEDLQSQGPASLEVCALLNKKIPAKAAVRVKYIGFEIENRFVIGYGLDYGERYREIPEIVCLD